MGADSLRRKDENTEPMETQRFRVAVLTLIAGLVAPPAAWAKNLSAGEKKSIARQYYLGCQDALAKQTPNASKQTKHRVCDCVEKRLVNQMTAEDILNGRLATGAEAKKVYADFYKKLERSMFSCVPVN